jgi:hypothetical protein
MISTLFIKTSIWEDPSHFAASFTLDKSSISSKR